MNEEADLEKPETIVINADYMHLQDLGSAAYTEFDNDEDIVDLYVENEDLMNYRCGLVRSEEHTSELQSHSDLVCRLLLEKKKKEKKKEKKLLN